MKIIIFDFDGVIADSLNLQIKSVNKFSEKFGYQKISSAEIFKDYSMREVIKKIKIPKMHLLTVIKKVKEEAGKHYDEVRIFKGMRTVLANLRKKFVLLILSSNNEKTIKQFLDKNNLNHVFSGIYTGKMLFDKHLIMKRIMKDFKASKEDIILICDEQRDIEAGKKSGIRTGAVIWGYNSKERLIKENPDFLFEKPAELLRLL